MTNMGESVIYIHMLAVFMINVGAKFGSPQSIGKEKTREVKHLSSLNSSIPDIAALLSSTEHTYLKHIEDC